ncbi:MAG: M13 family metallopeptidase [Bryobacteraceae bacterium]|nr:M13 family metallopeptidase [Bryobacteraceae bacterium]
MQSLLLAFGLLAGGPLLAQDVLNTWIDPAAEPCVDFYQYACGNWMKSNPIPPDQTRWSRFNELVERNNALLREILEQAAAPRQERSPGKQKIGDYYASCMDEAGIEKKGIEPIKAELEKIAALRDPGARPMFRFTSGPDFKNATLVIAEVDQGGLGLPDRDYYFKTDGRSVELRGKYEDHLRRVFRLLGDWPEQAKAKAQVVMKLETALAEGSLDRVARRDPNNVYHKLSRRELEELAPSFNWNAYFRQTEAPRFDSLNVAVPEFAQKLDELLRTESLDNWKVYLTWHLVRAAAPLLPQAFVNADFDFYSKTLRGAEEIKPRWKRCTEMVDAELGEALGREYVERAYPAESKQRTLAMVRAIEKALEKDIQQLSWMTEATKNKALEKLHAITNKIGYPEKWRDYGPVSIVRGDALGNSMRASAYETQYQLAKIGRKVDPTEWLMTPPTVNAYYNPLENNINFPAGILQPPFFDARRDDAVNFGAIGAVIGHELTHGFDDQGRQFDAKGNLADWWTPKDAKRFEERTQCFVDQYEAYSPVEGVTLNGKLTLGENVADNGGLRIALMALADSMSDGSRGGAEQTPEQRFFLGWGQIWCQNVREQESRLRAAIDPHSPGKYRVNGVVSNMPEFQRAFGCKTGQPMAPENRCRAW